MSKIYKIDKGMFLTDSMKKLYPNIDRWIDEYRWIEIIIDDVSSSFVTAWFKDRIVLERSGNYKTQDDALKALEKCFTEEKKYLKRLTKEANDTIDYFSNKRKKERERGACAAFLRCLGINFKS